jgi:hypothetical protein
MDSRRILETVTCGRPKDDQSRELAQVLPGVYGNQISRWRYFVNKLLRSLLRTAVYLLEHSDGDTGDIADRVKDRVQDLTRRARHAIYRQEDHSVRNAISFATGIGLGIGVGILLAPARGEETRSSIAEKVQDFGDRVKERFSPEARKPATGTEGM